MGALIFSPTEIKKLTAHFGAIVSSPAEATGWK